MLPVRAMAAAALDRPDRARRHRCRLVTRQCPRARLDGSHRSACRMAGRWNRVDEDRAELIRLLALGQPFQFRLSAAVAHAWSADGANAGRAGQARPALTAALAGRLAPAAADWLDIDPEEVEVSIHDGAGWGELALSQDRQGRSATGAAPGRLARLGVGTGLRCRRRAPGRQRAGRGVAECPCARGPVAGPGPGGADHPQRQGTLERDSTVARAA